VALVADVADGLGAAHAAGVVHRDVKPGNIVCRDGEVPTLVDFGIAKTADATTLTRGLVIGTASYIAPEQAQGLPVSPAGDVYSLACVLFELLTGRPPFDGESPVAIALKHVQDDAVAPSEIVDAAIPPAVDAVVLRCLSKDPLLRPSDGTALAAALRAAMVAPATDETVVIGAPLVADARSTAVMPPVVADADLIDPTPLPPVPPPPPPRTARRRLAPASIAVLVAASIAAGIALLMAADRDVTATRPVPDVTNASVDDAIAYLEGAGLDADVEQVPDDADAGVVIASDPAPGQAIVEGGTVTLSVSSGPVATDETTPPADDAEDDTSGKPGRGRGKKGD
jgi:serine/threonine-protein kinase